MEGRGVTKQESGASEVLLLQKGVHEQVLVILKGKGEGHTQNWGHFKTGA